VVFSTVKLLSGAICRHYLSGTAARLLYQCGPQPGQCKTQTPDCGLGVGEMQTVSIIEANRSVILSWSMLTIVIFRLA